MKIALPVAEGKLCMHFGHCETFRMFNVDVAARTITGTEELASPPHQPGLLPGWLAERGVTCVIAGGMGQRAVGLFSERGVTVITGAPVDDPRRVVEAYLAGTLTTGDNACDH